MSKTVKQRIPELSGIEFRGHASVSEYSSTLRALMRDIAYEIDFAAEEIYAVLSRQKGHPLLLGLDVKLRARKVAKRLHRAQECVTGAGIEAVKFYREFRLQFAEVITPPKAKPRAFDFNDI
jgi:hypothetical protein